MTVKYIDLIGIELEGAWDKMKLPPSPIKKEASLAIKHKCGNVMAEPKDCNCKKNNYFMRVNELPVKGDWAEGEVVSPPLGPTKVEKWLKDNYVAVSNRTCGMHVHVSFKSQGSYLKLMDRKFQNYFVEYMTKKGKEHKDIGTPFFFERLAGKNKYCTDVFRPAEQVEVTNGTDNQIRYSILNYCWKLHNTLECRMFPMYNTVEQAMLCVNWWIDCVESYLDSVKGQVIREELEGEVIIDFPLCPL